ncbi:MAG TPA: hypothetical protein VN633_01360 [Bryobacteraceae bacterium]|jgi:hypothetical protein|nr:hypothetical protein [Bryobacteraceae bacterium]
MPVITEIQNSSAMFTLPPLILHPFSSTEDSSVLTESSRASLVMQGLLPDSGQSSEDLDRTLLRGRYAELRMLFYVGKDLTRWLEQCVEVTRVSQELSPRSLTQESFVALLVQSVPPAVRRKLETWGVLDFTALFRRALGVHIVFSEPPPLECLNPDFLRRYHRYIDQWFDQSIQQRPVPHCNDDEFTYDLYASGEYTQMLEQNWNS